MEAFLNCVEVLNCLEIDFLEEETRTECSHKSARLDILIFSMYTAVFFSETVDKQQLNKPFNIPIK